MSRYRRKRR